MIKLFSVRVRVMPCTRAAARQQRQGQRGKVTERFPWLVLTQEKQKQAAENAEANGVKANKLSAGELRIQKGRQRVLSCSTGA